MTMTELRELLNDAFAKQDDGKVAEVIHGSNVLCVTSRAHGGLQMFLSQQNDTLVVRCDLMPVPSDAIEASNMAEDMLEMQSIGALPLSFFGRYERDGQMMFELIGSLSADSKMSVIVQEIDMLASNAMTFIEAQRD